MTLENRIYIVVNSFYDTIKYIKSGFPCDTRTLCLRMRVRDTVHPSLQ